MIRSPVFLLLLPALAVAAPVPKGKAPVIDIRDPDGKALLAADDLVSYDWATHSLTLKDGTVAPFGKALEAAGKFAICIDGKPAMEGESVLPEMSFRPDAPVIVLRDGDDEAKNQVAITYQFPPGKIDRRDVKELKAALEKAGKLKAKK